MWRPDIGDCTSCIWAPWLLLLSYACLLGCFYTAKDRDALSYLRTIQPFLWCVYSEWSLALPFTLFSQRDVVWVAPSPAAMCTTQHLPCYVHSMQSLAPFFAMCTSCTAEAPWCPCHVHRTGSPVPLLRCPAPRSRGQKLEKGAQKTLSSLQWEQGGRRGSVVR